MKNTETFNTTSHGFLDDFWLHALVIIPIEFGILHSTPLGPMLSSWFEGLWSAAGFEFAGHAAAAAHGGAEAATSAAEGFCHMHGSEMVCH